MNFLFIAFFCVQDREYIQKGKETMEITWELMNLNDGWKSEKVKVCSINFKVHME